MSNQEIQLTDGSPVPEDRSHTELKENGQQKGYVVLTAEERAKGFIRPVRQKYIHVGSKLRGELELLEKPSEIYGKIYVAVDRFEISGIMAGNYLTQKEVDQLQTTGHLGGCGVVTSMSRDIAETYARDPKFYGGTFCVGCGGHFPLAQFVWDGTDIQVGA